jgi:hypothetical protein
LASSTLPFSQLADQCQAAGLTPENLVRIAAELSRSFGVHDDEVAILKVEQDQLTFIYPPQLSKVGVIPLNHGGSLAARTANTKRPEVLNNFAQMRHASVFESVPVESRTRVAGKSELNAIVIQKVMSAPVIGAAGVLGVIQISRKGATPKAAGADFFPSELSRLAAAATALAKCFR